MIAIKKITSELNKGPIFLKEMAENLGVSEQTVRNKINLMDKEKNEISIKKGIVYSNCKVTKQEDISEEDYILFHVLIDQVDVNKTATIYFRSEKTIYKKIAKAKKSKLFENDLIAYLFIHDNYSKIESNQTLLQLQKRVFDNSGCLKMEKFILFLFPEMKFSRNFTKLLEDHVINCYPRYKFNIGNKGHNIREQLEIINYDQLLEGLLNGANLKTAIFEFVNILVFVLKNLLTIINPQKVLVEIFILTKYPEIEYLVRNDLAIQGYDSEALEFSSIINDDYFKGMIVKNIEEEFKIKVERVFF